MFDILISVEEKDFNISKTDVTVNIGVLIKNKGLHFK